MKFAYLAALLIFASLHAWAQNNPQGSAVPAITPAAVANTPSANTTVNTPATNTTSANTTAPTRPNTPLPGMKPNEIIPILNSMPSTATGIDSLLTEDLIRSLRDPFQPPAILLSKKETPKSDLETYQIKDFKLNGVITGPKKLRAMVTAPNGKVYFIRIGDRIGVRDGKVSAISPDSIKVVEYDVDENGHRLPEIIQVNMSGEVISLSKKEEL